MAKAKPKVPATASEIRQWANDNGYVVGPRGRLKMDLVAEFKKKTKREVA